MKKILFLLIAVIICATGYAQKYHDVIYLKNGSIVKGMIIEQVPNQEVTIKSGENTFVYKFDEIDRMAKELKRDMSDVPTGFIGRAELGVGLGVGEFDAHALKLNAIAAYRFIPQLSAGIGTGIRYYFEERTGLNRNPILPLLGDVRFNFLDTPLSPYVAVTGGYSFDLGDGFNPFGLILNPQVGISIRMTERLFLNAGVGYDLQTFEQSIFIPGAGFFGNPLTITEKTTIHALSINVGVTF